MRSSSSPPRVLFVNKFVPHYRREFYESLRERLRQDEIQLDLVYGDPVGDDAKKADSIDLDWAIYRRNVAFGFGSSTLIFQPVLRLSASYDLVIVEQANKLVVNPLLIAMNKLGLTKVAFWGHGKDFQGKAHPVARALKNAMASQVSWWFAYNDVSGDAVQETGFPNRRITRFMNTIDTRELKEDLDSISPADLDAELARLGLSGDNLCIYIGGMYEQKRLPFLFQACIAIRNRIPNFEILFVGSGVDRPLVDEFCAQWEWARVLGPTFGRNKAIYLKLSKLCLMPGLVGLAIIDSFVAQVPIVTTDVPFHSPEIEYLRDGENGKMLRTMNDPLRFAEAVSDLLQNETQLEALRDGCRHSAEQYRMSAMVDRVADGINRALAEKSVMRQVPA